MSHERVEMRSLLIAGVAVLLIFGSASVSSGLGCGAEPAVMQTARALVHDYREAIVRQVEEIENGVVTVTRAPSSPEAAQAIARHVSEMKQL